MGIQEGNFGINKFIRGAWARPCDTCHAATAVLFCRAHAFFLCNGCDAKVHAPYAQHERVWVCQVCENAPATVTCKADAAMLCAVCDNNIHSANPLASRHERVDIIPFFGDDVSTCSWFSPNTATKVEMDAPEMKPVDFLFSDADQFLDLDCKGSDSVVPVQTMETNEVSTVQHVTSHLSSKYLEIDFTNSKFNSVSHNHSSAAQSIAQSIPSTSMEVGIGQDGSSISENSYQYIRAGSSTVDASVSQGSDREAKVMRYREKRKNRKFEKTVRYASRKAYAETRPRIKGRFAKRKEPEPEPEPGNQIFFSNTLSFMSESSG